jgi:tRNA threonylcarbamoyladenosine biosynthesis protein TsaB
MRLLAIDTTEDACSAALLWDDAVEELFEIAPRRHSELILPMMDALLHEAGCTLADLDALAFARGPGSFTGLRIATAIVQGTAFGAGLPVVPVSSLQALAQGCRRQCGAEAVIAALDARMQEVYWGGYRVDGQGLMQVVLEDRVAAPGDVTVAAGGHWHGAGSGWAAYRESLLSRVGGVAGIDGAARIQAQDVARLAAVRFAAGEFVRAEEALPVYLRDQVAWAKP